MKQVFIDKKDQIAVSLKEAKSIGGLVGLLNQMQSWESEQQAAWEFPVEPINERALKYYLYAKKDRYTFFTIPKRTGGTREIKAPDRFLKLVQRYLNIALQCLYTPPEYVTGFVAGRSVIDNARFHTRKKYVYNIDLKDYFPSITFGRVYAVLTMLHPFRLDNEVARVIANIASDNGVLPQGAPTSPTLSNFVCIRLDRKLKRLAIQHSLSYSRYADDITFSSNENFLSEAFREELIRIIQSEGFEVKFEKERLQRYNVREDGKLIREQQRVTGLVVNEKVNVNRAYIKSLRAAINNWDKRGYEVASEQLAYYYSREKGSLRSDSVPPLENYIAGKLEYLGMVRGKEDPIYRVMKLQFDELCEIKELELYDFEDIMDLWENEGIKKAIDRFYNRKNVVSEE
jgi:RNA-directed DNA polymerase